MLVILRLKVESVMHRLMMEAVTGNIGFAFCCWFACYTALKRITGLGGTIKRKGEIAPFH